jgi:hypothetical protein
MGGAGDQGNAQGLTDKFEIFGSTVLMGKPF